MRELYRMTIYYSQRKASEQQEKPSAHVLMGVPRRRATRGNRRTHGSQAPARRVARRDPFVRDARGRRRDPVVRDSDRPNRRRNGPATVGVIRYIFVCIYNVGRWSTAGETS
jgi:hypothetical protein